MSAQERSLDDVERDGTRRVAQRQPRSVPAWIGAL